ncbi:Osmosensory transporter coiled coil [Pseudomonas sp. URIL14HWK12:I8]|nr:Osmosensory transporter coiled coil [Pseudomonas sp. URIL14HWK12:I8]
MGIHYMTLKETANKPLRGAAPAASDLEEAKELLQEHHDTIEQKIEDIVEQIAEIEAKRKVLVQQHPQIE